MKIFKNNRHPELTERPITLQINSSSAKYLTQVRPLRRFKAVKQNGQKIRPHRKSIRCGLFEEAE